MNDGPADSSAELRAWMHRILVPLPTLLSQLLVAFTIEFDNEFENRMAHRTTTAGRKSVSAARPKGAPWLVSQVMWVNVMQYLGGEGISVGELASPIEDEGGLVDRVGALELFGRCASRGAGRWAAG